MGAGKRPDSAGKEAPEANPSQSRARARSVDEMAECGRKAAEVIRRGGYQIEAAFAAGVHEKTYYRWLDGDDDGCKAFQAEVLPALFEQAREAEKQAEKDISCTEQGSSAWANWHKWKLEKRYRKVFGDLAQKHEVEVTGKDGGPIETAATVRYVVQVPRDEQQDDEE